MRRAWLALFPCSLGCAEPIEPTFTNVQDEVFTKSCAFSTCHGSNGSAELTLVEGEAYDNLVDVQSEDNPGAIRVVAGDVDASYIVKKLRGDSDIEGAPMPPGGKLPNRKLRLIEDWIEGGALDD